MSLSPRSSVLLATMLLVACSKTPNVQKGVEGVRLGSLESYHVAPAKTVDLIRVARIVFEPHVKSTPHAHPVPTVVYALKGRVIYQLECGPVHELRPGESFYMPPGVPVVRFDTEAEGVEFVAVFLHRNDDPLEAGDPKFTILYPNATTSTDRNGNPCRQSPQKQ